MEIPELDLENLADKYGYKFYDITKAMHKGAQWSSVREKLGTEAVLLFRNGPRYFLSDFPKSVSYIFFWRDFQTAFSYLFTEHCLKSFFEEGDTEDCVVCYKPVNQGEKINGKSAICCLKCGAGVCNNCMSEMIDRDYDKCPVCMAESYGMYCV